MLFLLSFKGSKGSDWHCISVSFSVQPNEDFYFVITVYQESVSGKGTFAIDEIQMSEGNCTAICKYHLLIRVIVILYLSNILLI